MIRNKENDNKFKTIIRIIYIYSLNKISTKKKEINMEAFFYKVMYFIYVCLIYLSVGQYSVFDS